MTKEEIEILNKELNEISDRLRADFPNPKDMRRKDEILSLIMTNGESMDIRFVIKKGRQYQKGLNTKKGYYRKGRVG